MFPWKNKRRLIEAAVNSYMKTYNLTPALQDLLENIRNEFPKSLEPKVLLAALIEDTFVDALAEMPYREIEVNINNMIARMLAYINNNYGNGEYKRQTETAAEQAQLFTSSMDEFVKTL